MARARNIKPGLMENEHLADLSHGHRLLFIYLWMLADREGRVEDRPKRIKAMAFPYDDDMDIDAMLWALDKARFILRYKHAEVSAIQVLNFSKHQTPHVREKASNLPSPEQAPAKAVLSTVKGSDEASPRSPDSLIEDSLIEDSGFSDSKDLSSAEAQDDDANQDCQSETGNQKQPDPDQPALTESNPPENSKPPKPDPLEGFDRFYRIYPRKQKRPDAERAWRKLDPNDELQTEMVIALGHHCLQLEWRKDGGQYIPLPASWINSRRWEDEPMTATPKSNHTDLNKIDHTEGLVLQPDGSYRIAESAR